ncbi:MAG: hypothetical protein Q9174_004500 [Haloplaca sp. 1 TL-2023]
MTAKTLVKERMDGVGMTQITMNNVKKVTQFRKGLEDDLEKEVARLEALEGKEERRTELRERVKWRVDERKREGWKERQKPQ